MRTLYSPEGAPSPDPPVTSENDPSAVIFALGVIVRPALGTNEIQPLGSGLPSASRTLPFTSYTWSFGSESELPQPERPSGSRQQKYAEPAGRARSSIDLQSAGNWS